MIRRRVRKASSRIGHQCRIAARRAKACTHLDIDFGPGWDNPCRYFQSPKFFIFCENLHVTQSCPSTGAAVSISIAVLTHNETREFKWLMGSLEVAKELIDEIVIVDDYSDVEFLNVVQSFKVDWPIKFFQRRLNKNFAAQRNFAKSQCTGRLIFFLDADEIPSARILAGLPALLAWMESNDVDVCYLPRLNIVTREEEIRDPLTVTPKDTIFSSWEDQLRILRNLSKLKFVKRIDEGLYGFEGVYRFPQS